jgi:hypothetical protein
MPILCSQHSGDGDPVPAMTDQQGYPEEQSGRRKSATSLETNARRP